MGEEKKKRSGISRDRAYRIQQRFKDIINHIISNTIHFKRTLDDMSDEMAEKVYRHPDWGRMPEYAREYLMGHYYARRDEIYRYHIGWMMWVDGKLHTRQEIDSMDFHEKERLGELTKDVSYRSPWSRVDSDKSRHVWLFCACGSHCPDKPIDRKFLTQ